MECGFAVMKSPRLTPVIRRKMSDSELRVSVVTLLK